MVVEPNRRRRQGIRPGPNSDPADRRSPSSKGLRVRDLPPGQWSPLLGWASMADIFASCTGGRLNEQKRISSRSTHMPTPFNRRVRDHWRIKKVPRLTMPGTHSKGEQQAQRYVANRSAGKAMIPLSTSHRISISFRSHRHCSARQLGNRGHSELRGARRHKVGKIVDVVVQHRSDANEKARIHSGDLYSAIQAILDQGRIRRPCSPVRSSPRHGPDIDASRSGNREDIRQQVDNDARQFHVRREA